MTDMVTVTTDSALIESILERGFDPAMPINASDFLRLVADAEAVDAAGPGALPLTISQMGDHFGQTGDALMLPVAVGHRWLVRLLDTTPVAFEESAVIDAILTLVRRLVPVLQQIVQFEAIVSRSARGFDGDHGVSLVAEQALLPEWLQRWRTFPVLASLVTLTLVQWIRAIDEMIRALEHDHIALAAILPGSSSSRAIQAIQGDAGDRHLGGRSVMIVTFTDGVRTVFKPKSLAITDVFRALVARVNAAGFSTPLRVHGAVVRDRHTWEEYVPHLSCNSEVQVERFYRRMGGWICLLQMLEGRDFWLDNLVADGEYPIFIDLETLMQPRRRDAELSGAAALAQDRIESSPLVTNIVAMPLPIGPGIAADDLGCFATPKTYLSPFPATEIAGVNTADTSRHGYRTWTHPEHAPMLNGHPVSANQWYPAIEAGYREMVQTLSALAPELLQPDGLIDQLAEHPVRTIFRDTWTCNRIIHRSTAPPLLGSYQRRRQFLERMDRDTAATSTGPIVAAEVRAMMSLDVPFFSAYGNDDAIHPPDGAPVPAFFDGTPRDRVATNLCAFSNQRLEEDVSLLRTSFWTAHPGTPVVSTWRMPAKAPLGNGAWREAALRIAHEIDDMRLSANDDTSSWIALTYHPTADIDVCTPIASDLLSGRSGLVVLFCDMWHATAEERWSALASESAHEVAEAVRHVLQPWTPGLTPQAPGQSMAPLVGAFGGIGGMLAAVKLAAEAIDDNALDQTWRALIDETDWEMALADASTDVLGGTVGLGLALTARREWIAHLPDSLRKTLAAIAGQDGDATGSVYPPGALEQLAGLPGERVARLLLGSRLGIADPAELQAEFKDVLESSPTAGDLLGVIELSEHDAPWWTRLGEVVTDAVEKLSQSLDRISQMDAAELALAMWRSSGDAVWLDRARSLGERWILEFNDSGSWFPADIADHRYRLSSIRGLPALASLLLRMGDGPVVSSPRTLDWQSWGTR